MARKKSEASEVPPPVPEGRDEWFKGEDVPPRSHECDLPERPATGTWTCPECGTTWSDYVTGT